MAALQKRNGSFRILFRYLGKQFSFTLGKIKQREADNWVASVDQILLRLEQNLLHLPDGTDIITFVKNGGEVPDIADVATQARRPISFTELNSKYIETHSDGALEATSLLTATIHLRHLETTLGLRFPIQQLTSADLQRHIDRRRKKKVRGRNLSPATLKKEITTLRAVWNWAVHMGLLKGDYPGKGLVYPKADEKPPFQTLHEIERRIAAGKISQNEREDLLSCLYLTKPEIEEFLAYVCEAQTQPWVYPLCCTAAHTGARRSELLRIEVNDINFDDGLVLIREKKRSRTQRTTRYVSLTPFLSDVLKQWLAIYPGGIYLFAQMATVARSKKRSTTTGHQWKNRSSSSEARQETVHARDLPGILAVTRDEAHDHFKRTLANSRWSVLRGFHVLRHSFISCLAAAGVDQRIIDDFVGHQTDEQRRRYRHLIPDVKRQAIAKVFG